jgi:hypothetical protein
VAWGEVESCGFCFKGGIDRRMNQAADQELKLG